MKELLIQCWVGLINDLHFLIILWISVPGSLVS